MIFFSLFKSMLKQLMSLSIQCGLRGARRNFNQPSAQTTLAERILLFSAINLLWEKKETKTNVNPFASFQWKKKPPRIIVNSRGECCKPQMFIQPQADTHITWPHDTRVWTREVYFLWQDTVRRFLQDIKPDPSSEISCQGQRPADLQRKMHPEI